MAKSFLKGIALGGVLAGLAVWMTTPKGKETKEVVEEKLQSVWKKIEKEYKKLAPEASHKLKREFKKAAKEWDSKDLSGDVRKGLASFLKKLGD